MIPIGIDPSAFASAGDHIAYFWESDEDFARGVKFLEVGIRSGDSCVVFGHDAANRWVLSILRDSGIGTESLANEGRLEVLGGHESAELMLANIGNTFARMLARGATQLRMLGNIGWGLEGWPPELEIIEFERRVTDAVANLPCVVVCMYDVRSLPSHLIVRAGFALHPFTLATFVPSSPL